MDRLVIGEALVPEFPRGVKFRFNKAKEQWVLLAPERLLVPDEIAVEVLKLCDGERNVEAIASNLAERFNAPKEVIVTDVISMLQDLADKGFIKG